MPVTELKSDLAPVRVVIVGWGRWGRMCHGLLASTTPGMVLHGIVSGDAEKRAAAAEAHRCRTYATLDEALADDAAELIVLATPNDTHADFAMRALSAGKHVLTDKPMAATLDEADAMIAAAESAGRVLSVFQNRRLDGDFLTVQKLIDEGRFGELRWAEMAWQGFGSPRGWRGDADRAGGRFIDLGSHMIDQLLVLFPEPIEGVYCRLTHEFEQTAVESDALLVLHFKGGRTGVVDVSSRAALPKPRFYLRGTEATFEKYGIDPQEAALGDGIDAVRAAREDSDSFGRLRIGKPGKLEARAADAEQIPTLPGQWDQFYANLRNAIRYGREPLVKAGEARRTMAIFEAAFRSAETGRVEPVDGE